MRTTRNMERLGTTIRATEHKGPTRYVTGVTTSTAVNRRISVEVAGAVIPAVIPGSFRANLAAGQEVRLSVQGSMYTIDAVLSVLTTPTVAAPPASASTSGIAPGVNNSTSGYSYYWTDGSQLCIYVNDIRDDVIAVIGDVNDIRDDVGNNADDLASLKTTANNLVTTVNSLKTTVAALRDALIAQGHVV